MSAKYDGCLIVFQEQGAHASVWRLTAAALPYSELCEDCGSGSGAAGAVLYRNVDDRTGAVIYQCESCLEASARRTSPHDPRPLVTLFAPGIYPCRDCGTETFCGVAHGAGHDHSVAARECTARTLANS